MAYFGEKYSALRYPIEGEGVVGLRTSQIGSIHAIASHFTLESQQPGVVVLPTGSGKTAVLMATPYLMRAERTLVLTPSVLVRAQIADDFKSLATLRRLGVLDLPVGVPRVHEVTGKLSTAAAWEALRDSDVVVGTPNSISPDHSGVAEPPTDLFDLLLVDEAHHSPARTWTALLERFGGAKRVLFTATPYRHDRKEIGGSFIYVYSVRRAQEDGVFGELEYVPVHPAEGQSSDVAIAKAAEAALQSDRAEGLDHRLMVRTDSRSRAGELATLYEANTGLKLRMVHSALSLKTTRAAIQDLRAGTLDGIICVNMLGEGFDFPALKVAAVHSPHKSLEVTLQFIGRFARTGTERLGRARFFAVPAEIEGEVEKLYREGAGWGGIVRNLSASRVEREQRIRESYEKFEPADVTVDETENLPLGALRPYFHVKVYKVANSVDVSATVTLPGDFEVIFRRVSAEQSAVVLITKETVQPRWTAVEMFARVEYDLIVVFYAHSAGLLFLNSSRRTLGFYEALAEQYTAGAHRILPLSRINRVLAELSNPEFFNIGMKNVIPHSQSESYRIVTGPRAHEAISESDGRLYHRGHAFGRFESNGQPITLGYSSASKVWSNRLDYIPEILHWCGELARKIASTAAPSPTGSGFDSLQVGEEVTGLPQDAKVVAVDWDVYAYQHGLIANYQTSSGTRECLLVDLALAVDGVDGDVVSIAMEGEDFSGLMKLRLTDGDFTVELDDAVGAINLSRGNAEITLQNFLRSHPFDVYLGDFSRLHGAELFRAAVGNVPVSQQALIEVDWAGVDITKEAGTGEPRSIHEHIKATLGGHGYEVLVYDHRSGEAADFVGLRRQEGTLEVEFYHCKGAGGATPGLRVGDVYEVCGQVVRSLRWCHGNERLKLHLQKRTASGSPVLCGTRELISEIIDSSGGLRTRYRVILVQPGVSKAAIDADNAHVLGAARDYLNRAGADLAMWVSA